MCWIEYSRRCESKGVYSRGGGIFGKNVGVIRVWVVGGGGGFHKGWFEGGLWMHKDVEGMGGVEWDGVGCYVWNEEVEIFSIFPRLGS